MPIYDCRDEATVAEVWFSRVFDANGAEITFVIYCDTDKGLVGREVLIADGSATVLKWDYHPAPLRLVKIGQDADIYKLNPGGHRA